MTANIRLQPIFYPKHFNTYAQCPERYYHERVERRKVAHPPSLALIRGIAAHEVMGGIASDYEEFFRSHGVPAVPSDLVARVERALPLGAYPSEDDWARDVRALTQEIKVGVAYLDGEARVLATEATYRYPHPGDSACPPFILAAKVDAVLLRHDHEGNPFLEVVDWKGGSGSRQDPVQELATRIVVQFNARRRLGVAPATIQNTTVYLGVGTHRSAVIGDDEGRLRWAEVKRLAAKILRADSWEPTPSPLCEWCPFFGNGCSLDAQPDTLDDGLGWLGSAAD